MAKYGKDVDVLVKKAIKAGWEMQVKGNDNHPVIYPKNKDCKPIVIPISMSDHRGYKNLRSEFRKAGLDC